MTTIEELLSSLLLLLIVIVIWFVFLALLAFYLLFRVDCICSRSRANPRLVFTIDAKNKTTKQETTTGRNHKLQQTTKSFKTRRGRTFFILNRFCLTTKQFVVKSERKTHKIKLKHEKLKSKNRSTAAHAVTGRREQQKATRDQRKATRDQQNSDARSTEQRREINRTATRD